MIGAKSKPLARKEEYMDQRGVTFPAKNTSSQMTTKFAPTQLFGETRNAQNIGAMGPSQGSVGQLCLDEVTKEKKIYPDFPPQVVM